MDAGDQALVSDEQQRKPRGFVNAAALGFDNAVGFQKKYSRKL